jgi:hypothetical protein
VAVCAFVAHALASIEKQPNSVGPQPVAAAVFAGLALIFAAMTVHRFRRRARLLRNARMLACTVTYSGAEGSLWRIDYRYRTAAGTEQTGSEHLDFRPSRVPAPGDPLAILATETDVQVM